MNSSFQDARELDDKVHEAMDQISSSVFTSLREPFVTWPVDKEDEDDVNLSTDGNLWSRSAYLDRVRTFKPQSWFMKPILLSPLEVARFGFKNVGLDEIECTTCSSRIFHHTMPSINTMQTTTTLTNDAPSSPSSCATPRSPDSETDVQVHKQLVTSHSQFCPWRTTQAPRSYMVACSSPALFWNRVESFDGLQKPIGLDLREWSRKTESLDLPTQVNVFKTQSLISTPASIILAICNWVVGDAGDTLECDMCGRICGIWNFRILNERDENWRVIAIPYKTSFSENANSTAVDGCGANDVVSRTKRRRLESDLYLSARGVHFYDGEGKETDGIESPLDAASTSEGESKDTPEGEDRPLFDPFGQHRQYCPLHSHDSASFCKYFKDLSDFVKAESFSLCDEFGNDTDDAVAHSAGVANSMLKSRQVLSLINQMGSNDDVVMKTATPPPPPPPP